jgi:hypothetical protein
MLNDLDYGRNISGPLRPSQTSSSSRYGSVSIRHGTSKNIVARFFTVYGGRREIMLLGREFMVVAAPYDEERRAWESIPDTVLGQF